MRPPSELDALYMARAIQLAQKGLYTTDPNPRVGCVIVRDGHVLGEGWHFKAGQDHAEIAALKNTENARGATVYVSLEPCSHHGRTPPCAHQLIDAGVRRVVAAMKDPNPLVAGRGLELLESAGIEVDCGVLQTEAESLNLGFIKRMKDNRPWVRSKIATSLDGRSALASGESKWITSAEARNDAHHLRAASSAILTGVDTVLADDPLLTARIQGEVVQPVRVILDTHLRTPAHAQIGRLPGRSILLTSSEDQHRSKQLQKSGFEVFRLAQRNGRIDLHEAMNFLAGLEVNEVLVEAGPVLNGTLLSEGLVDEWIVYMAPCILGDRGRGLFTIPGLEAMADKIMLKFLDVRPVGTDLKLTLMAKVQPGSD
ncbi:MAG: bifunctional diaminohydroxyphosphoribosylaminopyrimidine deaminase/5-amino-6-(5-phosphoribosylamino)uracil reductase RibD [Gammaproteobacteria bacterium]